MHSRKGKAGKTGVEKRPKGKNANRGEKSEGWQGRRLAAQVAEETNLGKGEGKQNKKEESTPKGRAG